MATSTLASAPVTVPAASASPSHTKPGPASPVSRNWDAESPVYFDLPERFAPNSTDLIWHVARDIENAGVKLTVGADGRLRSTPGIDILAEPLAKSIRARQFELIAWIERDWAWLVLSKHQQYCVYVARLILHHNFDLFPASQTEIDNVAGMLLHVPHPTCLKAVELLLALTPAEQRPIDVDAGRLLPRNIATHEDLVALQAKEREETARTKTYPPLSFWESVAR
jgi:hypothetical protein